MDKLAIIRLWLVDVVVSSSSSPPDTTLIGFTLHRLDYTVCAVLVQVKPVHVSAVVVANLVYSDVRQQWSPTL